MASSVEQVFISHAMKDADFAQRLAGDLQRLGVRVWIAPQSILAGEGWVKSIERGLRESSHVVIALTPDALESEWVEKETEVAIALERKGQIDVIPLNVRPCQVPLLLSSYQMVSFRRGYDAGLNQLAGRLGLRVAPPEGIERSQPTGPRLPGRLLVALGALLVLAISVVVIVGVIGVLPTPAPGMEPPPGPASEPEATDIPVPEATDIPAPEVTGIPVPSTDTPMHASSIPPSDASLHDTWTRPSDDMEMVYVPSGTFEMGSTSDEADAALDQCTSFYASDKCEPGKYDDETPEHQVTLDGFWIDKYEVTNAQYARCVAEAQCSPPTESGSNTRNSYYDDSQFNNYPVIYVRWQYAVNYCQWAGGRLPTEAEWEYAARGPDRSIYPWGDNQPDDTLLNYNWNIGDTKQVGSYPDGASWVGAMDMAGNVYEWVRDWHAEDYYAKSPKQNPTGPSKGNERVHRGGSFSHYLVSVRTGNRSSNRPGFDQWNIGFRCVIVSTSLPTPE